MDSHSNQQNYVNKVYINPNFTRASTSTHHAQMHVNPNYTQPKVQNTSKIFVNPKFMKPSYTKTSDLPPRDLKSISNKGIVSSMQQTNSNTQNVSGSITTQTPTAATTSRYSLVRHNAKKELPALPVPMLQRDSTTYKVNKYKSVPMNDIKRKLNKVNSLENQSLPTFSTNKILLPTVNKRNVTSIVIPRRNQLKLINNTKHELRKLKLSNIIVANASHLKVRKLGNLKKNNIPCPLFKKYGTCLRMSRGKCEFLHDKNHVSICRKFIKGICHDNACLLSHDLTTKKMPTCHFYLQGICTKEGCPYLHVKLNENTKICADFLKGYCDRGSKCLLRHIQSDKKREGTCKTKVRQKMKHVRIKSKYIKVKQATEQTNTSQNIVIDSTKTDKQSNECRYYQENNEENGDEHCEVIKPTRCKLGLLPSFIQL